MIARANLGETFCNLRQSPMVLFFFNVIIFGSSEDFSGVRIVELEYYWKIMRDRLFFSLLNDWSAFFIFYYLYLGLQSRFFTKIVACASVITELLNFSSIYSLNSYYINDYLIYLFKLRFSILFECFMVPYRPPYISLGSSPKNVGLTCWIWWIHNTQVRN